MNIKCFHILSTIIILVALLTFCRSEQFEDQVAFKLVAAPGVQDMKIGELMLSIPDGTTMVPSNREVDAISLLPTPAAQATGDEPPPQTTPIVAEPMVGKIIGASMNGQNVWGSWDPEGDGQFFIGGEERAECTDDDPETDCDWTREWGGDTSQTILFNMNGAHDVTDFMFDLLNYGSFGDGKVTFTVYMGDLEIISPSIDYDSGADRTATYKASDWTDESISENIDEVKLKVTLMPGGDKNFRYQIGNARIDVA